MAKEKRDISALMKLFDGLEAIGSTAVAVAADGKIGADDLKHLVELGLKADKVIAGVSAFSDAVKDVKDIQQDEAALILARVYELVKNLEKARSSNKAA